ncbi:tRNA 2'-phosphotransferase [Savitreella phatthalungensis]
MDEKSRTTVSRLLSKLLRHKASDFGLRLRDDGFAVVSELLSVARVRALRADLSVIREVVALDGKSRYTLRYDGPLADPGNDDDPAHWLIRANQGHSIATVTALELQQLVLPGDTAPEQPLAPGEELRITGTCEIPPVVLHGTTQRTYLAHIRVEGLSRMRRNHIHLATGLPGEDGVRSGVRGSADCFVYVDVARAMREAAITFYKSANGVILSPGNELGCIPPEFFTKVVDRAGNPLDTRDKISDTAK